jgi:diguanylate cyclase (GGDEF)-like protein/PAS domain S-box-containing protein
MEQITQFLTSHGDWLMQRVRELARRHGYTKYTSTQLEAWRRSVAGLTQALTLAIETHGLDAPGFSPDDTFTDDPASAFAVAQSRSHRARGVTLGMYLGLFKYYRRAYVSLLDEEGAAALADPERMAQYRTFVINFFDRAEIALSQEWADSGDRHLVELRERNRAMTNEKNLFLTLFESLDTPVFLLDEAMRAELMNHAAAQLLGLAHEAGQVYYGHSDSHGAQLSGSGSGIPLGESLPWLARELERLCPLLPGRRACRFEASGETPAGVRHFNVAVSRMDDASGRYTHSIVSLDDITGNMKMERALAQEMERASHYLNIVGSIVVALDAAGAITLINQAGCAALEYSEAELIGSDWVQLLIPEEHQAELRDRLFKFFSGSTTLSETSTTPVITKSGAQRLMIWKNQVIRNDAGEVVGILYSGTDITEQHAMEQALAEKELWLRNTFLALGEAIFILTPDSRILDANPAARGMFMMTEEELIWASMENLHADHDSFAEFNRLAQEAFEAGKQASFEFSMRRKNGDLFPTEHSVSRITGDDGAILGTVSVVRDISSRKWAELKLRRSEEKFRRIFETIEDGYIVTDMDGVIQMVNPATCNILGYTESELLGHTTAALYRDTKERDRINQALDTVGVIRGVMLTVLRKDGTKIIVDANTHLVYDEDGKPVGKEGTFRDITRQIEATHMLQEREKQYRALFENNHAVMLLVDPKTGRIVDANPAAADFYGYPLETLRGMALADINAQDETSIFKEMVDSRREKRAYFIHKHTLANGDVRDVEVYSGPIMIHGTQMLYSVIHDVTERVRLAREMKRMATTDALTGAGNRHDFFRRAEQELRRAERYGHSLTVVMLDIDYFKSINDTHGHQTGDAVLKALAALIQGTLRDTDIFGRLGGEEFAVVLPETDLEGAALVADRLRIQLGDLTVRVRENAVRFTVSIGVSEAKPKDRVIEDVINRADEALYKAKRMGRNRVETY